MRIILQQLGKYKKDSVMAPVFTALEVIMEVLLPFVTAKIIDEGLQLGNFKMVYRYGALMVVMALFSLLFGAMAGAYAASASAGLACQLRENIYSRIQTFSFANIDKYSTAGLVTRMTTDVTNIQNAFQMILRIAVRAPFMLITSMVMCFLIDAGLSTVFLAAMLFLAVVLVTIMISTMKIFKRVFRQYDDLNASVQENVTAIRVVKAFVREDYETEKFSRAAEKLHDMFVKAESRLAFNNPSMMLVIYSCILAVSWFGSHHIVGGSLSTGQLTSMLTYITSIMMSLMLLSMIFVMVSMSMASVQRIAEVLQEQPEINNPAQPVMELPDGSIDFNHVCFRYQKESRQNVLTDIDLHIKAGETIGVIGSTGSGKTSLVNLISRLYDVDSGTVCVGGVDVRNYDMTKLRSQVAVVLQKNVLFSGTILDNLRWGNEEAGEEECIKVCRAACADEFIERLPDRYHTYIERGGTNVSGGQKQRLCIARALLKKPKILILDDSTSAVDTATDAKIREAFSSNIPGTTKIIIAQRISSVEHADRILILDHGCINGFDSSENLLKTNQIYRELYETQTRGNGDFDMIANREAGGTDGES